MSCSNPIKIYSQKYKTIFTAPCGHCLKCRIDHRNMWTDRINFESKGKENAFITLTYDEDHIGSEELSIEDGQKFIKRLRRRIETGTAEKYGISKNTKIKYYMVGEYGDTFGRKHLHAIIIGLDFVKARKLIKEAWGKGNTTSEPVNATTIRYTLKYLDKQLWGARKEEVYGDKQPPFAIMSKGIGKDYLAKNKEKILEENGYKIKGKLRPIPKYWNDLLMMETLADSEKLKEQIEKMHKAGFSDYHEYKKAIGRLEEEHIIKDMRNRRQPIDTTYIGSYEPINIDKSLVTEALND